MTIKANRKNKIIRYAWLVFMLLCFSLIQNSVSGFGNVIRVRALLLIPATVAVAMFERERYGMFFGLFAGALWDIFAAGNNFNSIYLFVVGFACGILINTIMRNNFVTHFLLTSISTAVYCVGYWIYHYLFNSLEGSFKVLFTFYLAQILLTIAVTPFIFFFVRWIEKKYR